MARKILIVDDFAVNRQILRRVLNKNYDILEAANGLEAKALLEREHKAISAVLLDLVMPEMDGYELLRFMRALPELSQIPVVIVTGTEDEDARVKALALGANDFVSKPYNPEIIMHCLRNNIQLRETSSIINTIQRDKLTHIYNREFFFKEAADLINAREAGFYVLACFDIDNFKLVNDQYGSAEGDRILKHIGEKLNAAFGAVKGICGRITGDIFVVLYPNDPDIMEKIALIENKSLLTEGLRLNLSFSVGRYVVNDRSLSVSAMYDRAYIAKQSVKGRYDKHMAYFDDSMLAALVQKQRITSEMDEALKTGQFEVWFQPQYNHSTGALIGAEALARWRHPERGLISPGEFVPIFEQNGFVYELDKFVWETSCRCLRKWLNEGETPLPISVNLSRVDVFKPDLIEVVTGFTKKYDIPVELLRLEITESAFSKSAEQIISVVKRFIALGFTVEIDDFGSGYSSLNTLKDVPAQVLKLDMRFLESSENSQRGGNILESIVRMAKWLGMSVIAEGVEAVEQANYLKTIGCDYVQGYLYARPMTIPEYESLSRDAQSRERRLLSMETVENLDNNSFWDPKSMETLIFNSFVGGACIYEYSGGKIELLRANDKYAQVMGSAGMTVDDALKLDWTEHLDAKNRAQVIKDLEKSVQTKDEVVGEYVFLDLPGCPHETYLRSTMRVIASSGARFLVYCTNENITAQRIAEQKERGASEQLHAIMDNVGSGITAIVIHKEKNEFLFANDKFFELMGFPREKFNAAAQGYDHSMILPEDRDSVRSLAASASVARAGTTLECRINKPDGSIAWIKTEVTFARFSGIEDPVQIAIYSDITEEKNRDDQLRFLNTMAHDLLSQHDINAGINSMLTKLMEYFDGDRAYIFEFDLARQLATNTYEVCANGVSSEKDGLLSVPLSLMRFWLEAFKSQEYYIIDDISALGEERAAERQRLLAQGIRSLFVVPLYRDGLLIGMIGVDDPRRQNAHIERLAALGDYIAVRLTRRDLNARIKSENDALMGLINDIPGGFIQMRVKPDGAVIPVYFNEGFYKLAGMEHDELMRLYANDAYASVHPDDVHIVRKTVGEMLEKGEAQSSKFRLRHGDGGYIWVRIYGRMAKSDTGEISLNIFYSDSAQRLGRFSRRRAAGK